MADVFLSYSRDDTDRVAPLADALTEAGRRAGFAVWWDPMMLPGTTDFDQYLQERLDAAKCVVVVWSATSVQSHYVKAEAEEGRARGILTPVLIDPVKLPLSFRFVQTADLTGWRPGRLTLSSTGSSRRSRNASGAAPRRRPPSLLPSGGPPANSCSARRRWHPSRSSATRRLMHSPGSRKARRRRGLLDAIGTERWSATVTGAVRSAPAVGPNGDIYVITEAGALHGHSGRTAGCAGPPWSEAPATSPRHTTSGGKRGGGTGR